MPLILVQMFELAATYIEQILLFGCFNLFFSPRSQRKSIFILQKQLSIVFLVICVTLANKISIFSFRTFYIGLLLCAAVAVIPFKAPFLSIKSNSTLTVSILYFFALLFIENYLAPLLALIFDIDSPKHLVFSSDSYRVLYVAINKLIIILIFLFVKKIKKSHRLKLKSECLFYIAMITLFLGFLTSITYNLLWDLYSTTYQYVTLGITFLFLLINAGMFWMAMNFSRISLENENTKVNTMKYENLQDELKTLMQTDQMKAKILHDTKNHLAIMQELIQKEQFETLETYLQEYHDKLSDVPDYLQTGCDMVDVVLNSRLATAQDRNIRMECNIVKLSHLGISPMDLCSILTNLLDNAIEACTNQNRLLSQLIQVEIKWKHNFLHIKIGNTTEKPPFFLNGQIQTTKEDPSMHGFGLQIVNECVKKYWGSMSYSFDNAVSMFTVSVILCVEEPCIVKI